MKHLILLLCLSFSLFANDKTLKQKNVEIKIVNYFNFNLNIEPSCLLEAESKDKKNLQIFISNTCENNKIDINKKMICKLNNLKKSVDEGKTFFTGKGICK